MRERGRLGGRSGVRIALGLVAVLLGLGLVAAIAIPRHIVRASAPDLVELDAAPARPVAIVLGAKIWGDQPSHMLEDRLAAALAVYESGRCEKILLTGAHRSDDDDEVGVMRRWLEARGVAPDDLYLDHAGFRTLDSMVRAKTIFGVERALVISQDFHLARAVYLGRHAGLELVGGAAPAGHRYPAALHWRNDLRERAARVRAWLDLHVLDTQPRFAGPPVDMRRSGRATH